MTKVRVAFAALLALATVVSAAPKTATAETCPLPQYCMILDGQCTCEGYYCNDRFYCAIPH